MKKGKILRIKLGYNPNSSSLGTDLSVLLVSAAALTVLVNLLDAAVRLWLRRSRSNDVVKKD